MAPPGVTAPSRTRSPPRLNNNTARASSPRQCASQMADLPRCGTVPHELITTWPKRPPRGRGWVIDDRRDLPRAAAVPHESLQRQARAPAYPGGPNEENASVFKSKLGGRGPGRQPPHTSPLLKARAPRRRRVASSWAVERWTPTASGKMDFQWPGHKVLE